MAIATSTALAVASIGASAAGTVASFSQASQQKRMQQQAQKDAEKAMAEARKKLEINYMDKLSIQKEPYELQREAALVQGAEAIQAGREQERGAAATAGRIQLAQNQMQGDIRTGMQQEMFDLEKLKAQEQSRLRDVGVQLDLEEVTGQQQMAADAQKQAAAYTTQAFQGITSAAQQGLEMVPLYMGGKDEDALSRSQRKIAKEMLNTAKEAPLAQKISAYKGIPESSLNLKPMNISATQEYNPFQFLNNPYLYKRG